MLNARADEALLDFRSVIRHSRSRRFRVASALIAIAVGELAGARRRCRSQSQVAEQSWREPRVLESNQRFAFELRFGPYRPQIDDAFPQQKPYETVFGTDRRVEFALEFDWQLLRIPHVGTLRTGVGWGYTHMSAPAAKSSGEPSAEETSLGIMPMYGVGVLRVDELVRRMGVPLVGYGKAGIGYGLYWTGNDSRPCAAGTPGGRTLPSAGCFCSTSSTPTPRWKSTTSGA